MPSLSPTMEQGNIAKWTVQEGGSFAAGDVIAEIETDKATMGWEAQDDGIIGKIIKQDGSKDIPVGTVVALSVEEESEMSEVENYQPGGGSSSNGSAAETSSDSAADSSSSGADGSAEQSSSGGSGSSAGSSSFPTHQVWTMPALSPTMQQGNIAKWYKQVGDEVATGDGMVEVETDKATMMWESVEEGFIAKILAPDGTQDISVGEPVVVIVDEKDTVPAFASYTADDAKASSGGGGSGKEESSSDSKPAEESEPKQQAPPQQEASKESKGSGTKQASAKTSAAPQPASDSSGSRIVASPYARKLARNAGVSLSGVRGSGPNGRVVAADVQSAIDSGTASSADAASSGAVTSTDDAGAAFSDTDVSQIKKVTAKRLLESKTTVPHYYVTVECAVDELLALRGTLNKTLEKDGGKLSVNDLLIKAAARALKKVPEMNSSWHGDYIRQYENVDISVAVQTPAGLMVPVVRDADLKGLSEISSDVRALAEKAKNNKLSQGDYTGGTFTISNLGMYGVSSFCAIVNPPQAGILACGGAQPRVVLDSKSGAPKQVQVMAVTLSGDHRVVDGAVGAQWLAAFKSYIETPQTLML